MTIKELYKLYQEHPCITTDSRECPAGSIFLALKGDRFDGNQFALKALLRDWLWFWFLRFFFWLFCRLFYIATFLPAHDT